MKISSVAVNLIFQCLHYDIASETLVVWLAIVPLFRSAFFETNEIAPQTTDAFAYIISQLWMKRFSLCFDLSAPLYELKWFFVNNAMPKGYQMNPDLRTNRSSTPRARVVCKWYVAIEVSCPRVLARRPCLWLVNRWEIMSVLLAPSKNNRICCDIRRAIAAQDCSCPQPVRKSQIQVQALRMKVWTVGIP